ncbi:MAG: 30S ribosomal protein S20 [Bdellovibrionales bacterium]|nr:30S ribosomal protein S20 [Bdellovibrionales bacterium]
MANHPSAEKQARSSKRKQIYNNIIKGKIRSLEKGVRAFVIKKEKTQAETTLKNLLSELDKAVSKGCFHKNKTARKKSQYYRLIKTL